MSWQLHVFRALSRTVRFFEAHLPIHDSATWGHIRNLGYALNWPAPFPRGVSSEVVTMAGVRCESIVPQNANTDTVLFYIHGGGGVLGWVDAHRDMLARIAQRVPIRALGVDYRLAPERPFPVPLDECVAVYRAVLDSGIAADKIVFLGDSSGGNLTVGLLLRARALGLPMPCAALLISPFVDLTFSGDTIHNANDPIIDLPLIQATAKFYAGTTDPHDPMISTIFADLHGLPPLVIDVGTDEILLSDSVRLAQNARDAGIPVSLTIWPHLFHGWHLYAPYLPEANQLLDKIAGAVKQFIQPENAR
jgi:epsilon-lactone hydrolase